MTKFLRAVHRKFIAISTPWFVLGIATFMFCAGFFLNYFLSQNQTANRDFIQGSSIQGSVRESSDSKEFPYIKPLLLCNTGNKKFDQFEPLEREVVDIERTEKNKGTLDTLGFYFQDLKTGTWTGVGENEKFSPASLLKVPVMIAAFKYSEANPNFLFTKIFYKGDFDVDKLQTIQPQHLLVAGRQYTVYDLLRRMIGDSDNNAAKLLQDSIPSRVILNAFTDIGFSYPLSDTDYLSPKLYSFFFRILYNASYLNREFSEKAMELLTTRDFSGGLYAGVPSNIVVAQKFGERTFYSSESGEVVWRELHDCGIVYHPAGPYLLCVMTKGKNFDALSGIIQKLSYVVYQTVSQGGG